MKAGGFLYISGVWDSKNSKIGRDFSEALIVPWNKAKADIKKQGGHSAADSLPKRRPLSQMHRWVIKAALSRGVTQMPAAALNSSVTKLRKLPMGPQ